MRPKNHMSVKIPSQDYAPNHMSVKGYHRSLVKIMLQSTASM